MDWQGQAAAAAAVAAAVAAAAVAAVAAAAAAVAAVAAVAAAAAAAKHLSTQAWLTLKFKSICKTCSNSWCRSDFLDYGEQRGPPAEAAWILSDRRVCDAMEKKRCC